MLGSTSIQQMLTYVCLGELAEAGMQISDKAGDAGLVHDNLGHINATNTNSNKQQHALQCIGANELNATARGNTEE